MMKVKAIAGVGGTALVAWLAAWAWWPGGASAQGMDAGAATIRGYAAAQVARGGEIFRRNCAECHGANAQGAPDWHRRGADGKFPPPPLNGAGHAWHHPPAALKRTIREGTAQLGGSMPAWGDRLSGDEVDAVLAYIVTLWPEELYQAWRRRQAGS
jgi:mono/diheme cytochrome c family protein